jgi:hypothetical protein
MFYLFSLFFYVFLCFLYVFILLMCFFLKIYYSDFGYMSERIFENRFDLQSVGKVYNKDDKVSGRFVSDINSTSSTCKCPKIKKLVTPFSCDGDINKNGQHVPRCTQCGDLDSIVMGIACINCHSNDLKKFGYTTVKCNRCNLPRLL